ncbi:hypothetical protein ART_0825 [Arthrobacter sp. PAMC 25486]|uniref:hypothetical protein n=1 Tax=Arthrobacter sp. PAMC 25486 TaxID=1494608 RepID=UPI00053627C2|nr:hypothetical protein ART_0825 [Arthrobacter sp. PAMC 25486]
MERILPTDPLVAKYETRRTLSGTTVTQALTAAPLTATLDGRSVPTWSCNGTLNTPTRRASAGDQRRSP